LLWFKKKILGSWALVAHTCNSSYWKAEIRRIEVQDVGIDNPPMPKTDTQETENLDKAIFS
jgi:hypothetical protein